MNIFELHFLKLDVEHAIALTPYVAASGYIPNGVKASKLQRLRFWIRRLTWRFDGRHTRCTRAQFLALMEGSMRRALEPATLSSWQREVFTAEGCARRFVNNYELAGGRFPIFYRHDDRPRNEPRSGKARDFFIGFILSKVLDWVIGALFFFRNGPPHEGLPQKAWMQFLEANSSTFTSGVPDDADATA